MMKVIEGDQNPVCDEVATSDISGTTFEAYAARVKDEVEVHVPGHP